MTTDIRDGVAWEPWYLRRAEYEGQTALLIDLDSKPSCTSASMRRGRYVAGVVGGWFHCPECGTTEPSGEDRSYHDSLTDAIAAFEEAERKLLEEPMTQKDAR